MHKISNFIVQNPWRTVAFLLFFHVSLSALMTWVAYSPYLSSLHNGQGFWKFAIDATLYHKEALNLVVFLEAGEWGKWQEGYSTHPHVRLIALAYWLFGSFPFVFEIVNAPVWVFTIILIYLSSFHLFNKRIGLSILTSTYMLFPSVLLSSMQAMRDQFYILGFCLIIYGLVIIYKHSWRGVIFMIAGYFMIMWTRSYILPVLLLVFIPWLVISFFRSKKKISVLPLMFMTIVVGLPFSLDNPVSSSLEGYYYVNDAEKILEGKRIAEEKAKENVRAPQNTKENIIIHKISATRDWVDLHIVGKLKPMRSSFLHGYDSAMGSAIDIDTNYTSIEDVVLYFPRAMQIGFLSPFPEHWITKGQQTGRIGRIISGLETIVMYIIFIGFFLVLFFDKKRMYTLIPVLLFSSLVIVLLGYVIPNIGTIYRMRHGMFVPFYIMGVYGLTMIFSYYNSQKISK